MDRQAQSKPPMTYGNIKRLYPTVIDDLAETVADCVHRGTTIKDAVASVELPLSSFISPAHQQAVRDWLTLLASTIREVFSSLPEPIPIRCPSCCSIDTAGGICRWCRRSVNNASD